MAARTPMLERLPEGPLGMIVEWLDPRSARRLLVVDKFLGSYASAFLESNAYAESLFNIARGIALFWRSAGSGKTDLADIIHVDRVMFPQMAFAVAPTKALTPFIRPRITFEQIKWSDAPTMLWRGDVEYTKPGLRGIFLQVAMMGESIDLPDTQFLLEWAFDELGDESLKALFRADPLERLKTRANNPLQTLLVEMADLVIQNEISISNIKLQGGKMLSDFGLSERNTYHTIATLVLCELEHSTFKIARALGSVLALRVTIGNQDIEPDIDAYALRHAFSWQIAERNPMSGLD